MKIALLITSLGGGGAERVMAKMANHWAGAGHQVLLVSLQSAQADAYPLDLRIERIGLGIDRPSRGLAGGVRNNWLRMHSIRSLLSRRHPDVVISFMSQLNVLTLIAKVGLDQPLIVSERIDPTRESLSQTFKVLRTLTYPAADGVAVQTDVVRDWFARHSRHPNVRVIPNPVEPPGSGLSRDAPGRNAGRPLVAAVGRLDWQKGHDLLLEAFAQLAPQHPNWDLVIYGDGGQREALTQQARTLGIPDRVALPGRVEDPVRYLSADDLFVLPSRFEGFPNALLEAMAGGLPVVAFDCPSGPSAIISHDKDGLLVPVEDLPGLTRAMDRLMRDAGERQRLAAEARQVTRRFGVGPVMERWDTLIADVLAARQRRTGS